MSCSECAALRQRVEELERVERYWRHEVVTTRLCPVEHKQPHISHDCVAEVEKLTESAEAKLARCVEALEPFIRRHCGLCVPVDEQGRMGEVTTESCVCDADQKQARAALAAAKGE